MTIEMKTMNKLIYMKIDSKKNDNWVENYEHTNKITDMKVDSEKNDPWDQINEHTNE